MEVEIIQKPVRRLYLRVHRDRRVTLTIPIGTAPDVWRSFLAEKKEWIRKSIAAMPERRAYAYTDGEEHVLLGRKVVLRVISGAENRCVVSGDTAVMTVKNSRADRARLLAECWAAELRAVIAALLPAWEARMRVRAGRISIRRTVSRWGSCHVGTGDITMALDLSAKPRSCIEAVLVHELNHLIEKGHTPRFHQLMDQWIPDWKDRTKQLNSFPREF